MRKLFSGFIPALAALSIAATAVAKPPEHAPAHGWRKKNDPAYVGYTGTKWERDYDIGSGRCNREEIGAVLGGVVGGVIGSRSSSEHRTVAIILGTAAGALIGAAIGRELDEGDRACFGHALEMGKEGQRITWVNSRTGVSYVLVPGAGKKLDGRSCRNYLLTASRGDRKSERRGLACLVGAGEWKLS
jgi:surface antigen